MKRIVIGLITTLAIGSAIAQDPAPAVAVRADAGVVQVEGSQALGLNSSAQAQVGQTITVTEGTATLTFPDGCVVTAGPGTHVLQAVSPCKSGVFNNTVGNVAKTSGLSTGSIVAIGFGGLAVAGVALSGGGSDKPSSP